MPSFVKSNRKCVRIHYKCIIEMLFNRLFNIFCMFWTDARIPNMLIQKHGKHIISRHLIVILLSVACLLTRCKSIFNYLPLRAQNLNIMNNVVRRGRGVDGAKGCGVWATQGVQCFIYSMLPTKPFSNRLTQWKFAGYTFSICLKCRLFFFL